ncbi:Uncharacterized protein APZ42_028125 [Daphnia magna]|uniref:Uncharacterized protein n=1 Tax=Daphnia magna TaxID=35525 RepID=A0A164QUZ3_9CRUS|nr:Uncharacterized protein APZ42_028125 [Daphnia magna]
MGLPLLDCYIKVFEFLYHDRSFKVFLAAVSRFQDGNCVDKSVSFFECDLARGLCLTTVCPLVLVDHLF